MAEKCHLKKKLIAAWPRTANEIMHRSTRVEIGKTRNCVETRGPIPAAGNFPC